MTWKNILKKRKAFDRFRTSGENQARRRAIEELKNKYPTYPKFYSDKTRKQFNKELKRKIREKMKEVRREGYTMPKDIPTYLLPRGKSSPRDSKKVRDAQRDKREQEEAFGNVTDSPSFGQPQPTGETQQRKGTVGSRRDRTRSLQRRGAKERKGGRKAVPKNPFR